MKITIFGLSITSSWGNGHATTFRALCQALHRRGHRIVFFEHNVEWYQNNRDLPEPPYCDVKSFESWEEILPSVRTELRDSDIAMVGSYFPDGIAALEEVLASNVPVKAFYDIDTPITVRSLRENGRADYLLKSHLPELDIYFSFTGGPLLQLIQEDLGSPFAVPLYCSVDPDKHCALSLEPRFACDLSYMGTYAPDRQPKIDELLCVPARNLPHNKFIVAGPQYPSHINWPENVERIMHLNPCYHAQLYSSSRITLNVTRREMVVAGYSPSVRLFEAAACGAAIASDNWPGLETFFTPGREILLATGADDIVRYLKNYDDADLRRIGRAARDRVLAGHTSDVRAREFEQAVEIASSSAKHRDPLTAIK
ncbi:MAG TPA: glycosyltransferase [Candidatus Angelobacter sp.]|nr:glycosyltransferase [Candidatus Angelobacter sp.]